MTCPTLVDPANGTVSQPEDVFDSTATYECVQGFTLSDSTSRVCQASGMWSGSDPDCNSKLTLVQCTPIIYYIYGVIYNSFITPLQL